MSSFVDTNVSIGYIFAIDPLNNKSINVFKRYAPLLWSKVVKKECNDVFKKKKNILVKFYENLRINFNAENFHDFQFDDLKKYVYENYSEDEAYEQILSSLNTFWYGYVVDSFPIYESFMRAIDACLNDLRILSYGNKKEWEECLSLTGDRVDDYLDLRKKLKLLNVHSPDDDIVLDAHDYNLGVDDPINFITFDGKFYRAVCQVDKFSFDKVLGKQDFL